MTGPAMRTAEQATSSGLDADAFLRLLADNTEVTFQTLDDTGANRRDLCRILHGTLAHHARILAGLNGRGAGVFWMVNAGDGKGRKTANVQRIRALFVDLDGAPLEPVLTAALPAHCIVETSPGRWHAYWRVTDCPLQQFAALQKVLAARFQGDARVHDLPRLMRVPGFDHRKAALFRSRIVKTCDCPPYSVSEIVEGLDLSTPQTSSVSTTRTRRTLPAVIPEGERNTTLLSLAGGLVRRGHRAQTVSDRLQRINAERCATPLCATEVDAIAAQAVKYGSSGFAMLPHVLLDSPCWKTLAPPVHDIILTAFRRYDGSNQANIALTWADFEGLPGFRKKTTFYKHRAAAIASGILLRASEGRNSQTGKKPDLFAIAPQYLPVPKKGTLPQYHESTPLHR